MFYKILIDEKSLIGEKIKIDLIINVYDETKGIPIWKNSTKITWTLSL